ncbi:High mobility group protein B1 (Fragment) [Lemmus lemmus]
MPAKEKGKFEDMANADKARYEREMKTYIPPKGETKKKFKDPNAPKRPPSAFYLFCSEYRPKIKGEHPGLSIDDVQPYGKKAAELKERYGKESAAYRAKGKPDAAKKGWSRRKRARKRRKRKMIRRTKRMKKRRRKRKRKMRKKMMMMNKLVLAQFFFLSIKHLTPLYTTHSF